MGNSLSYQQNDSNNNPNNNSNNEINDAAVIDQCGVVFSGTTLGGYTPSGSSIGSNNLDGNNTTTVSGASETGDDVTFVMNNESWFQFCSTSGGTWQVTFDVTDCIFTGINQGAQMAILIGDPTNLVNVAQAPNPTYAGESWTSGDITLNAGECAYLVVDGFAGDACDYSYELTPIGATDCNSLSECSITDAQDICIGGAVQLTGSGTAAASNPWVSSNVGIASVNSTGLVSGVSAGSVTITYTDDTGCTADTTITVNSSTLPTFTQLGDYCQNETPGSLPTTSINSIAGSWSPATISTATVGTQTYTFTPASTASPTCATTNTMDITINAPTTPTFDPHESYCVGATIPALPTTSTNGFTGTWSPAIDNTTTTTYTFTPTAGQCASTQTLTIPINPLPSITAAAIDSSLCDGESTTLFPTDFSEGLLVESFTMTFGSAFSYTTSNTSNPGSYAIVVNGTYTGAGACEQRDGAYWFFQGCNNITPIEAYPWQWNGANPETQATTPTEYNLSMNLVF